MKRILWSEGDQVTEDDLTEIGVNVEYSFCQDLFRQIFDAGEYHGGTSIDADGDAPDDATTVRDAVDLNSATVKTYGFFGDGFRVVKTSASAVVVKAGWGLIWAAAVGAGFSNCFRVRLASDYAISAIPAAGAGKYRRDIITVQEHLKNTTATILNMDSSGTVSAVSATVRAEPEVIDGGSTELIRTQGVEAATAATAARPAIPANHVLLAEVLVSDAGIVNAANVDGVTPGVKDFRPRLFPRKAAGFASPRRATCSMDEGTSAANYPDVKRWGAKAVGEEIVYGVVKLSAVDPAASAEVVMDTSRDWRDMDITVEFGSLLGDTNVPGGAGDTSFTFSSCPIAGSVTCGTVRFYSGTGGTGGYTSPLSKTAADGAAAQFQFYARTADGVLCAFGKAHTGTTLQIIPFRVTARGPLGLRPLTGVES